MPKKGFKTITVREEIYDWFKKQYENLPAEYKARHGLTSFSGFCSYMLAKMIEQEKKHTQERKAHEAQRAQPAIYTHLH